MAIPASLFAQLGVSITIAPPALPVYEQPMIPSAGYLWTPGYWSYGDEGYFWVPGTWVEPPTAGLLWTPGYWGWGGDAFAWNEGYWGQSVGFYGGVNYGFGYGGVGYGGGYWNNGAFFYNRSVNNVNVTNITNVYSKTVINETTVNHVSYNGGTGGITARPTAAEETAAHEHHTPATAMQTQHVHAASTNHELLASVNRGRPAVAATAKPGEFSGSGVVAAKEAGAPYKAPAAENKAAASKATENKATENKATENKAAENKAATTRTNENKAAENKAATTR
ncbi:MAG: YXWGXW repeat-containing protein, partial [Candidatus Sulfotelmatobacter sp.]